MATVKTLSDLRFRVREGETEGAPISYRPALADIRIANAPLPVVYENAKTALTNCARIDECQKWANKAEALASYARQADDDTLRKLADRIQARAVRRCGQLLKQFDGRGGNRSKSNGAVVSARPTQRQASEDAGMSQRQRETAVRVANVPAEIFEEAVESDDPPTVTKLAETGKKSWPPPPTASSKPLTSSAQ